LIRQTVATAADLADYQDDLQRIVGDGAAQLRATIDDIMSGQILLPGMPESTIELLVPAIVTLSTIPGDWFTGRRIRDLLTGSSLSARDGKVLPAQVIDVNTLELLCPNLTREQGLGRFLARAHEEQSSLLHPVSLSDLLILIYGANARENHLLDAAGDAFLDDAVRFWDARRRDRPSV
jgi:hypothetical protein